MFTYETYPPTKIHHIKNQWDELNRKEFISLSGLIIHFINGKINQEELQLEFLMELINYKQRKRKGMTDEDQTNININLLQLANQVGFMLNTKQEKINLQVDFTKNFIDNIVVHGKKYYGPEWEVEKDTGIFKTNMRAEEFVDAHQYYSSYFESRNEKYLNYLVASLYRPISKKQREIYDTNATQKRAGIFAEIPYAERFGVYLFFQAFMNYLMNKTVYSFLFSKTAGKKEEKINLGLSASLYGLAEKGYGSKDEVSQLIITEFFSIQLNLLINNVKMLHEMETKPDKIAEKTGLTMHQIKQII